MKVGRTRFIHPARTPGKASHAWVIGTVVIVIVVVFGLRLSITGPFQSKGKNVDGNQYRNEHDALLWFGY
jgi:hypothetical protein